MYIDHFGLKKLPFENVPDPLFFFDEGDHARIHHRIRESVKAGRGLTVVTGPIGSGKTTTIYALIRELLHRNQNPASIITIEDPIESEIEGVSQTAVSTDRSWNYAAALRAALRQGLGGRLSTDLAANEPEIRRLLNDYFGSVGERIRTMLIEDDRVQLSEASPEMVANLAVCALEGGLLMSALRADPDEVRRAGDALVRLLELPKAA